MTPTASKPGENHYELAPDTDAKTADWIKEEVFPLTPYRDESLTGKTELRHLRWFYESAPEARSETFFPRTDGMPQKKWKKTQRLIPQVNLIRPCVTTFVASVFNGQTVRKILDGSPYQEQLQEFINGPDYEQAVTKWAAGAMLYGVAIAVPQVSEDGMISIYLPDPCGTYIWTDPLDIRKITKVAEVTECSIRYFTLQGYGILTKNQCVHIACDYGDFLPVAYAAGEDCRSTGRIYSVSLCRDALHWSIAVGDSLFKARQLQAKETCNKLVITGVDDIDAPGMQNAEMEQQTEQREREATEIIRLPMGCTANYIAPTPQIQQSIDLARTYIGQLATAISIPADALDANYSMTGSGGSAEAARIRAIPLLNKSRFLQKQWASYESDLVLAITGQMDFAKKVRLKLSDLRKRVKVQIAYDPYILPQSPNEMATTTIALKGAGLISDEEAVRRVTNNSTPKQVAEQAKEMVKIRTEAGSAAAVSDGAFKDSSVDKPNQYAA